MAIVLTRMGSFLDRWRKSPQPTADAPSEAAAGREHTQGYIVVEETNQDLVGFNGYTTYDKMYRTDGDTRQAVQLVVNPIVAGTWEVVPYGGQEADEKAQKHAEIVKWALWEVMNPNLIGHLSQMLPVLVRSGFAPYEVIWTKAVKDGKTYLCPRKLDLRLPRTIERWFQDVYGDLTGIVQNLPVPIDDLVAKGYSPSIKTVRTASDGSKLGPGQVEIKARDLLYYRLGAEGDNWEGTSLLRPAYKHWYMKDTIEKIDAMAQEREAMGVPICYPPPGATPDQLTAIEEMMSNMRSNEQGYIVMPGMKAGAGAPDGQGWLVEVIGYDRTGSGRDPQPSLAYHTNKIAAAFISEFMRLGHGQVGARATAQVQADPFLLSVEALVGVVEAILNELVQKFVAWNLPDADRPPKLQMSLVDSTSLTSLADYVLKLTQVGALLPDQELEDFLRARADLPPANPESVKKRGKKDDDLRREIVTGGGANGDAPGQNQRPGTPHGTKTAKPKSSGASSKLSVDADGIVLRASYEVDDATGKRIRYRQLTAHEESCDLDGIEDYLDDLPATFHRAAQHHVLALSKPNVAETAGLADDLHNCIKAAYEYGQSTAVSEIAALRNVKLSALPSVRDEGIDGLAKRSTHASRYVVSSISLAAESAALNHSYDSVESQLAAETAGMRALKHVGMYHGQAAFNQGRHDVFLAAAKENPKIGYVYSAILDNRTCDTCMDADDGVVRSPDDPVRVDRRPPNRHCHSTASGFNWCRCLEFAVPMYD